jgi:hypothetical protein
MERMMKGKIRRGKEESKYRLEHLRVAGLFGILATVFLEKGWGVSRYIIIIHSPNHAYVIG